MSQPIIEVQRLSKRYRLGQIGARSLRDEVEFLLNRFRGGRVAANGQGDRQDFWALHDVSFDVQPGEVIGIIGRNGAGKSTLLKILSRITEPTEGEAIMRGRIASLLEVGTGFHPELSGRENIFLNGAILGMKKAEVSRKLDEIVAFAEIDQFLDTPVKRYSSGMYVRLAFAVAAHLDPEILIVDEVLAVGDMAFQKKCLGKLREVATGAERTVLFVSHNLEAVATLCSRSLVLSHGRLEFLGETSAAIQHYAATQQGSRSHWSGQAGDDTLTLLETWVQPRDAATGLDTGVSVEIGLRFILHRAVAGLVVGYHLYSEYGYELLYSLHDDAVTSDSTTIEPGEITKRFLIPPNSLASGSYRIVFDLGLHQRKRIIDAPEGELSFHLENITGIGRRFQQENVRGRHSLFRPAWPVETVRH